MEEFGVQDCTTIDMTCNACDTALCAAAVRAVSNSVEQQSSPALIPDRHSRHSRHEAQHTSAAGQDMQLAKSKRRHVAGYSCTQLLVAWQSRHRLVRWSASNADGSLIPIDTINGGPPAHGHPKLACRLRK